MSVDVGVVFHRRVGVYSVEEGGERSGGERGERWEGLNWFGGEKELDGWDMVTGARIDWGSHDLGLSKEDVMN